MCHLTRNPVCSRTRHKIAQTSATSGGSIYRLAVGKHQQLPVRIHFGRIHVFGDRLPTADLRLCFNEATTHNVSSGKALAGIILGWFSVAGTTVVTVVLFVLLFGFLASTTGGVVTNVPDGGPIDVPTTGPTTGAPSVKLPPPWVELPVNNTNMTATINDKPATIMAATVPVTTPEACATLAATLASVAKRYGVKTDPEIVFFEGFRLALTDPATMQKYCIWSTTDTDPSSNPLSLFEDSATTGAGKIEPFPSW